MRTIKNFFNLMNTLYKACVTFPVDGALVLGGTIGLIVGIAMDELLVAFLSVVLAMHSVYTAFRLNSKIIK